MAADARHESIGAVDLLSSVTVGFQVAEIVGMSYFWLALVSYRILRVTLSRQESGRRQRSDGSPPLGEQELPDSQYGNPVTFHRGPEGEPNRPSRAHSASVYATIDGNAYDVAARSCARCRVAAIGQTAAVGRLLQRHRVGLPEDIEHHQEERRVVEQRTRLVQEEMFDLDEQRLILVDVGARTTELLAGPDRLRGEPNDEVVSSVRSMLETQRAYLGLLFDDQARYFDVLIRLGTTYGELNGTAEAFLRFIDERVLWTRNAEPMGWSDLVLARDAGAWLSQPGQWLSLARALGSDSVTNPWRYAPPAGAPPWLGILLAPCACCPGGLRRTRRRRLRPTLFPDSPGPAAYAGRVGARTGGYVAARPAPRDGPTHRRSRRQ